MKTNVVVFCWAQISLWETSACVDRRVAFSILWVFALRDLTFSKTSSYRLWTFSLLDLNLEERSEMRIAFSFLIQRVLFHVPIVPGASLGLTGGYILVVYIPWNSFLKKNKWSFISFLLVGVRLGGLFYYVSSSHAVISLTC